MKQKLFSLICVLFLFHSSAFAYRMWSEQGYDYPKGKTFGELMQQEPKFTQSSISINKQLFSSNEDALELKVNTVVHWTNMARKRWITSGILASSAYRTIKKFKYSISVYISGQKIELETSQIFDVADVSTPLQEPTRMQELFMPCYKNFNKTYNIDISNFDNDINYIIDKVVIEMIVIETDEGGERNEDLYMFRELKTCVINKNAAGNSLKFKKILIDKPIINALDTINPIIDVQNNGVHRNLVYNHPDAAIALSLSKSNLPVSKQQSTSIYKAYTAVLASVGIGNDVSVSNFSAGNILSNGCYVSGCNFIRKSKSLAVANDYPFHKAFLKSVLGNNFNTNFLISYKGVLLNSRNSELSSFNPTVLKLEDLNSQSSNYKTWIFHLRDFALVNYENLPLQAGTILNISSSTQYLANSPEESFSLLGYSHLHFNDHEVQFALNTSTLMSMNKLEFEIIPQAQFDDLTFEQREPKKVYIKDRVQCSDDVIHVIGKSINTLNYSENIYQPDYKWEISIDGSAWLDLDKSDYRIYKIDRDVLPFANTFNAQKDLVLKTDIFERANSIKLRQICVLKTFCQNEEYSIYNYKENNKYYIRVVSPDFYTYTAYNKIEAENFAYNDANFDNIQNICHGDNANTNIEFDLIPSYNLSNTDIDNLKQIARYQIIEVLTNNTEQVIANRNSYNLQLLNDSSHYRCKIIVGYDTISNDIFYNQLPLDTVNISKLNSNVFIKEKNYNNRSIKLLAPRNYDVNIINEDISQNFEYKIRRVVALQSVNLLNTDFTNYTRIECENYITQNNWNFLAETGSVPNDVSLTYLRNYCLQKSNEVNSSLLSQAVSDSIASNAWQDFSSNLTTLSTLSNSNEKYFIKRINTLTSCSSDSVLIELNYLDSISDNTIQFASCNEDTIIVAADSESPRINGMLVTGAYGNPQASSAAISYKYQWIYRKVGSFWQELSSTTDNGNSTMTVARASLSANKFTVDSNYEIARIVYSRANDDQLTQITDTSNILVIKTEDIIRESDIIINRLNECSGTQIEINIEDMLSAAEALNVKYIWTISDSDILYFSDNQNGNDLVLNNATADFYVSVKRLNLVSGFVTDELELFIPVINVQADFEIYANDLYHSNAIDQQQHSFMPGTRLELLNNSEQATDYLWTLQIQNFVGYELAGTQSQNLNAVCYLYNQGFNKIQLTASNGECASTIIAENLFVNEPVAGRSAKASHFAQSDDNALNAIENNIEVYPTLLNNNNCFVNIDFNKANYKYSIFDISGRVVALGSNSFNTKLNLSNLPSGIYLLNIDNQIFKLLKQ